MIRILLDDRVNNRIRKFFPCISNRFTKDQVLQGYIANVSVEICQIERSNYCRMLNFPNLVNFASGVDGFYFAIDNKIIKDKLIELGGKELTVKKGKLMVGDETLEDELESNILAKKIDNLLEFCDYIYDLCTEIIDEQED